MSFQNHQRVCDFEKTIVLMSFASNLKLAFYFELQFNFIRLHSLNYVIVCLTISKQESSYIFLPFGGEYINDINIQTCKNWFNEYYESTCLCDTAAALGVNSLAPVGFDYSLKSVNFKLILTINIWSIFCEISIRWLPQSLTDHKSTLVQVMAWCRQATSHYLSQCWPRSLSPHSVSAPK